MIRKWIAIFLFFIVAMTMAIMGLRLAIRQPEIIDVFTQNDTSNVIVKNFPLTDKGKIDWWLDNKNTLFESYGFPKEDKSYGTYTVTFWDYGNGYKKFREPESSFLNFFYNEMYCFDSEKENERCLDKNILLIINRSTTGIVSYTTEHKYYQKKNGDIFEGE